MMGLDTVELVIRFEDAFGITISDEVAAQLTTPGKVADYVLTQVARSEQPSCLSQQAFYFLRGTFVPFLKIRRSDFRPNTQLENLIPLKQRRQVWADMRAEIGPAAIPDLARPVWLFSFLFLFTVAAFVVTLIYEAKNFGAGQTAVLLGLLASIVGGYAGAVLTRPLKRHFKRRHRRVRDLATYLSFHGPHTFKKKKGWTRAQVTAVIREIIIDEVGAKDFTEDSHFIDDMHLG